MESTRAMTGERRSRAEPKNCEILLLPTADRHESQIPHRAGLILGQIPRYVASLDGQMPHPLELQVGSSPPPSRHVKPNCGNKFSKIFRHYQFLVPPVFAPHFKQRHIPRCNYIKRQQQKEQRAMTRERGLRAESKNCETLLLPTADRRLDTKVKCPTGRALFWVKFPHCTELNASQMPGDCPGGGWAVLELTGT